MRLGRDRSNSVRRVDRADAAQIARLSTQLGYPSSAGDIEQRLGRLGADKSHAVFVAVNSDGIVVGWVHVHASYLVESDPMAEIGGLVVDEAHRGSGIGKLLLRQAEAWARNKDLRSVYLRSNVIRTGARAFYKKLGYSLVKTQYAFCKTL